MKETIVKIISIDSLTPDVIRIVTQKPHDLIFLPGQATDISIPESEDSSEMRPFTFTSLPGSHLLEFTIKTYPEHNGFTKKLLGLTPGDHLMLHGVFGSLRYRGEGVFIAGGAGVTPFISIFRHLKSIEEVGSNRLIYANKTKADIILEKEFRSILGTNFINILSDEKVPGFANGRITENFIDANNGGKYRKYYVCGPPGMTDAVLEQLSKLGVTDDYITTEKVFGSVVVFNQQL